MKKSTASRKFRPAKLGTTLRAKNVARGSFVSAKQDTRLREKAGRGALAFHAKEASIKQFCDTYGVTRDAFTRMTGFSPRAVANWSSGKVPGPSARKRLTELTRLFDALSELVDRKAIPSWLGTSNPSFEGSTPLQVIERGEIDRLWRMIWQLESGNSG
jgi:DNA-binding transcriptional regulator YiaG